MHPFFKERTTIDPETGCWLWTKSDNGFGYGKVHLPDHKERSAHRLSWAMHVGPIPDGLLVLHHCDVPRCVNPDHLFLGDMRDNTLDCMRKGRHVARSGEANGAAKLTWDAVAFIRENPHNESMISLGKRFGVDPSTVRSVVIGETWTPQSEGAPS